MDYGFVVIQRLGHHRVDYLNGPVPVKRDVSHMEMPCQ